ncbi:hypothetical protein QUF70_03875 [Desulfobacterales bacterium HSG17]|nr:hypothetical protein [Desulfobacterales bacterium HSG17]
MDNDPIASLIDMLSVSGHSRHELKNVIFQSGMHVIVPVRYLGFVGGNITQIHPDEFGRIIYRNWIISPLMECGHVTRSLNEIGGICFVCKRLICTECLFTCDLSGELVCPRHSIIKNGVVIGNNARSCLLWRLKARRIAEDKEFGIDVRKQIQHK